MHGWRWTSRSANAQIDYLGAVVDRVPYGSGHHVVRANVRTAEDVVPRGCNHLYRHDAHVERHAGDADTVVRQLADRTGHVRAMTVEIERVVRVPDEIAG